jgi:hypothetical protein
MRRSFLLAAAGIVGLPLLSADPAPAQNLRSWVSGLGNDMNPCSRALPCRTFNGALAKTVINGVIYCVDAGDFGSELFIIKSITIDCHGTAEIGVVGVGHTRRVYPGAGDRSQRPAQNRAAARLEDQRRRP